MAGVVEWHSWGVDLPVGFAVNLPRGVEAHAEVDGGGVGFELHADAGAGRECAVEDFVEREVSLAGTGGCHSGSLSQGSLGIEGAGRGRGWPTFGSLDVVARREIEFA